MTGLSEECIALNSPVRNCVAMDHVEHRPMIKPAVMIHIFLNDKVFDSAFIFHVLSVGTLKESSTVPFL